jgi:hypothetical protein
VDRLGERFGIGTRHYILLAEVPHPMARDKSGTTITCASTPASRIMASTLRDVVQAGLWLIGTLNGWAGH